MSVKIYGASDDTIVVERDLGRVVEEFVNVDGDSLLAFSDGTILRVTFGSVWRIAPVVAGSAVLTLLSAPEDDEDNYSDVATLDGAVSWVVHGIGWAQVKSS